MRENPALVVFAVLLLAMLLGLPAASSTQDTPSPFTETIEVRLVNVEVVVEDSKGERVHGLTPDRFRLTVDGEDTAVEYFSEVRNGRAVGASDSSQIPGLPTVVPGRSVSRHYLVFLDDYFAVGAKRNFILTSLDRQLGQLRPEDQVAIVRFGGRRLELMTGWTGDRERLRSALGEAARRPAFGLFRFATRQQLGTALPSETAGFFPGEVEFELEREAAAVASAMRALGNPPGRKILLLLSGGWPVLETSSITRIAGITATENDLDLLRPAIETANLLGYTIFTIDVAGIRPPGSVLREAPVTAGGTTSGVNAIGEGAQIGSLTSLLFQQSSPGELAGAQPRASFTPSESLWLSTLRVIARDTGGRALIGSHRTSALSMAATDARSYYWLGFTPRRARDNSLHSIRVKVAGEGYRVRSRRGFRDLSREAEVSMTTVGAALFDRVALRNELGVSLGEPLRISRNKFEIPLRIDIPLDKVTFLPFPEGHAANLELRLAAVDRVGGQSEVPVLPVSLHSADRPRAGEVRSYRTSITLRRRPHDLAISLFDPVGGRVLVGTVGVEP